MSEPRKYRLSICTMTFLEKEVVAIDPAFARAMGEHAEGAADAQLKFRSGPHVHRVDQLVPTLGKPGEFHWEEVPLRS